MSVPYMMVSDPEIASLFYLKQDSKIANYLGIDVERVARVRARQPKVEQPAPFVAAPVEEEPEPPRITAADLRPTLEHAYRDPVNSIRNIQNEVAQFYGIDVDYMRRSDRIGAREPRVSHPRQMAMFMARECTRFSLKDIGKRFGGRDHATVIHALKAVQKRAQQDPYVELEIEVLRERFAA